MELAELKNLKILIVDSNVFISKTLYSILEAFGIAEIMVCHTLEEAEKKYYNTEMDCIFLDFIMEDKKGIDFIKNIRAKQSSKNSSEIPIILVTGVTSIETIIDARDAGVSEIISKPFSPDQILQKLDNAINNKRQFIDVEEYIGPNRRRRKGNKSEWKGENDRRDT